MPIKFLFAVAAFAACTAADSAIPLLNYTCPGKLEVHADQGGPVYINGKETKLKRFNDNAYEATGSGVTLSITINPDGTSDVSYTGPRRAHGVCQPASASAASTPSAAGPAAPAPPVRPAPATAAPRERNPKAESACLAAVAKTTNVARSRLKVTDVMTAQAGTGVTVSVPGADAPWSCLVDKRGRVQNAMYTGKEGGR